MTQEHPITPPLELFKQWEDDILNERDNVDHVLDCAWRDGFRAGADQELEACINYFHDYNTNDSELIAGLRAARRPEPPSQAEQALDALKDLDQRYPASHQAVIVRAALERLRELERTLALTQLEQAVFWANASIARNESPTPQVKATSHMDELNPLKSIEAMIACSPRDWSLNKCDAWIYGIVFGWDGSSMYEVAHAHDWDASEVERLKKLHEAWDAHRAMKPTYPCPTPRESD